MGQKHTVNALPVALLLLIEESVLVLRQHFLLTGHLRKPPAHSLGGLTIALKCGADSVDDPIHGAQALALSCLLRGGETPRGLPIIREGMLAWVLVVGTLVEGPKTHQRRPPNSAWVDLNMVGCWCQGVAGEKIVLGVGSVIGPCAGCIQK